MFNADHPFYRAFAITLGIGLVVLGWICISWSGSDPGQAVIIFLAGLTLAISGACILALELAKGVVEVFSRLFGQLFFSDNQLHGPQPVYSIPEARRVRGNIEGAWEALEKIAEDFPNEFKVYIEMMDIAVMESADFSLAEEVLSRGLSALKKKSDQKALEHAHALIAERFHTREERSANLKSLGGRKPDSKA